MSKPSLLLTVLSLQACCGFASLVKSHVAADGTITNSRISAQHTDVQGLLSEVEAMADSGAAPDDEKVKTIDELLDQLLPVLQADRDTRQAEVKDKTEAVKKCNDDQSAAIRKISSGIKKQTDDLRKEHQACRKEEKDVHHAHKVKTCTALTNYLKDIEEKSPEQPANTDDDDAMVEWVEAMSDNWCDQGKVANEKEAACNKAKEAHENHKDKCDKLQDDFELGFCTWRTRLMDTCAAQETCYEDAMREYNVHKAETLELVKKWKVEYVALKKMSCYINVWLTEKAEAFEKTSTADAAELKKCKELAPDETKMEVSFIPAPPAKTECSLDEVKNYPGTDGFKSTEYAEPLLDPAFVKESAHCLAITEPTVGPVDVKY
jgi:hypothetical protein